MCKTTYFGLVFSFGVFCFLNAVSFPSTQETEHIEFSEHCSPKELLASLKLFVRLNPELEGNITINSSLIEVTATDAVSLVELIHSDISCLRVNNVLSSFREEGASTVGIESRRMIEGYIQDSYPPASTEPLALPILKQLLLKKLESDIDAAWDQKTRKQKKGPTKQRSRGPKTKLIQ